MGLRPIIPIKWGSQEGVPGDPLILDPQERGPADPSPGAPAGPPCGQARRGGNYPPRVTVGI